MAQKPSSKFFKVHDIRLDDKTVFVNIHGIDIKEITQRHQFRVLDQGKLGLNDKGIYIWVKAPLKGARAIKVYWDNKLEQWVVI